MWVTGCLLPAAQVGALGPLGSEVFLHVHTHVREDAIVLYGFAHADERRCFEALIGAHGVGPTLALSILSALSPAALCTAVLEDDVGTLCLVPGVGKKTAARLLLELKARLDLPTLGDEFAPATAASSSRGEVRAALTELGYGPEEISGALEVDRGRSSHRGDGPLRAARTGPRSVSMPARREVLAVPDDPESGDGDDEDGRRAVDPVAEPSDEIEDLGLRPRTLDEFVGQSQLTEHLRIVIEAALRRRQPVDHLLFAGPPGLGKTSLAGIVAGEMGVGLRVTAGPSSRGPATSRPSSPTCKRATSCSSTRSTDCTVRSRRSSIRRWRTSRSTS